MDQVVVLPQARCIRQTSDRLFQHLFSSGAILRKLPNVTMVTVGPDLGKILTWGWKHATEASYLPKTPEWTLLPLGRVFSCPNFHFSADWFNLQACCFYFFTTRMKCQHEEFMPRLPADPDDALPYRLPGDTGHSRLLHSFQFFIFFGLRDIYFSEVSHAVCLKVKCPSFLLHVFMCFS